MGVFARIYAMPSEAAKIVDIRPPVVPPEKNLLVKRILAGNSASYALHTIRRC